MLNLKPREDKFYDLFIENSKVSHQSALALKEFINDLSDPETKYGKLKALEHQGDTLVHEIFEQLNKTFITPLDREDVHAIAKTLDEVTDIIEQTGSRFLMYNVTSVPDTALTFADMIVDITEELVRMLIDFKPGKRTSYDESDIIGTKALKDGLKQPGILKRRIIEINRMEEVGDSTYRRAVRELFINNADDPLHVLKWKDIFENLEACLDSCEEVANNIEGVVMKNA